MPKTNAPPSVMMAEKPKKLKAAPKAKSAAAPEEDMRLEQLKSAKGRALNCYRCNRTSDDLVRTICHLISCRMCYETWFWCMKHLDTFKLVADSTHSDESKNALFNMATQVFKQLKPPLFPQKSIRKANQVRLIIQKSLIGKSRQQYIADHSITPEECSRRMETLEDVHGNRFRGVLTTDDEDPYTRYLLQRETKIELDTHILDRSHHAYKEQADEMYESALGSWGSSSSTTILPKFRTCSVSQLEIKNEAEAAIEKKKSFPLGASAAGACGSEEENSDAMDEEAEEEDSMVDDSESECPPTIKRLRSTPTQDCLPRSPRSGDGSGGSVAPSMSPQTVLRRAASRKSLQSVTLTDRGRGKEAYNKNLATPTDLDLFALSHQFKFLDQTVSLKILSQVW